MKISFIIPAYNEEKTLGICLEAIQHALKQVTVPHEIIVVNNASTDKTAVVARSVAGVMVIDEPQKGIVWARRAGSLVATGDLLANIDADTMMPEDWVKKVLQEFKQDPELLALSGPHIFYDVSRFTALTSHFFYIVGYAFDQICKLFNAGAMLQGGNFILRREAYERIGGYNTAIEFWAEDVDIGRRVNKIGKVKWTFKLPMKASGRRFVQQGLWATGMRYCINFIWAAFFKKPFSQKYADVRVPSEK